MIRLGREFARFLRERPLWWVLPILAFYGGLAFIAWLQAETPDSPFLYQVF